MLHNIYKENAVNWVLKWRLTSVGPFSRNKSHYVPALQIIILHLPVKMILKIQNTGHKWLQLDLNPQPLSS